MRRGIIILQRYLTQLQHALLHITRPSSAQERPRMARRFLSLKGGSRVPPLDSRAGATRSHVGTWLLYPLMPGRKAPQRAAVPPGGSWESSTSRIRLHEWPSSGTASRVGGTRRQRSTSDMMCSSVQQYQRTVQEPKGPSSCITYWQ